MTSNTLKKTKSLFQRMPVFVLSGILAGYAALPAGYSSQMQPTTENSNIDSPPLYQLDGLPDGLIIDICMNKRWRDYLPEQDVEQQYTKLCKEKLEQKSTPKAIKRERK